MTRLRTLIADSRGAAAVEFAIILPILSALVIGVIQYGGMIIANQQMHDGVSSGAVFVMRGGSDAATIKTVSLAGWANQPADAAITVTQTCSCAGVTSVCNALCADSSYPQSFTSIAATGTYTGLWGSQSMSATQVVRTQ
jgi:Flp pilus assembly protein TadG